MRPSSHTKHLSVSASILLMFIGGILAAPKPASADPHATFYTATGQQQLFFNTLAALNQADYVEPATTPEGVSASDDFSREKVLDTRIRAGFNRETDDRVIATKTELAGILTRGITLEGHDLWSAYLAHQFAIEAARRDGSDKVMRIFCERGLGLENCDDTITSAKEVEKRKEEAYVVNPVKSQGETAARGLAVLFSGTEGHQTEAEHIAGGGEGDGSYLDKGPYAHDDDISAWWKNALADENDLAKQGLAAVGNLKTLSSFVHPRVNPGIWNYISSDSTGRLDFNKDVAKNPSDELLAHEEAFDIFLNNQIAMADKAATAVNRVEAQTEATASEGHRPDTEIAYKPSRVDEDEIGEINTRVTVPASVKRELSSEHAKGILANERTLQTAQARSETDPTGNTINAVELVARSGNPSNSGAVQGISTQSAAPLGQVAHAEHDPPPSADYNSKVPVDLSSPIVPYHFEQGGVHSLAAIGYGSSEGGCGCGDMTEGSLNDYGRSVMRAISQR